jgi:hypothetical protein
MAKSNLIPTRHSDEFDTETASVGPADFGQPYVEGGTGVWCQHPHFQVGAGLNTFPALDGTSGNGDVHDGSFSHAAFAGEDDGKIRVHARAIPEFNHVWQVPILTVGCAEPSIAID